MSTVTISFVAHEYRFTSDVNDNNRLPHRARGKTGFTDASADDGNAWNSLQPRQRSEITLHPQQGSTIVFRDNLMSSDEAERELAVPIDRLSNTTSKRRNNVSKVWCCKDLSTGRIYLHIRSFKAYALLFHYLLYC